MAAPSVEVNITTKDGKSSKFSELVTDVTGSVTLPVLHQVLNKIQTDVNSSLTILVEAAKKSESAAATGDNATASDNDELDDDSEEDEEDERRPEKRKSSEELENQKVAKVR